MPRDPRTDPRPGDIVLASMPSRTVQRAVIQRDGGNVWYKSSSQSGNRVCWILTWREWCARNNVKVCETAK